MSWYLLLVPQEDIESLVINLKHVGVAVIGEAFDVITMDESPRKLSINEVVPRCIGAVASSAHGISSARKFLSETADATETAELALLDLTQIKVDAREAELQRFVIEALCLASDRHLYRISDLSKSLAALRQTHERTQASFAQLERFVFDNHLAHPTESLSLLPGINMAPLKLADRETLIQRLPISSYGLCDIAIYIEHVDFPNNGTLSVALLTDEDNELRACWNLKGSSLASGLVRLSMNRSLDAMSLTPIVELCWQGEGQVRLCSSLYHPDLRLQPAIGGIKNPRVLALRCWSYLPSNDNPLSLGAILPGGDYSHLPTIRVIDSTVLESAVNLTPDSEHSRYLPEHNAVMVHPLGQGVSIVRLTSAIPAGAVYVDARIHTLMDKAPLIEYSLAIAPSCGKAAGQSINPISGSAMRTPWVELCPKEKGELHLPLAEALDVDHDLFLMTQLSGQPADASWGWALFDRIRVSFE